MNQIRNSLQMTGLKYKKPKYENDIKFLNDTETDLVDDEQLEQNTKSMLSSSSGSGFTKKNYLNASATVNSYIHAQAPSYASSENLSNSLKQNTINKQINEPVKINGKGINPPSFKGLKFTQPKNQMKIIENKMKTISVGTGMLDLKTKSTNLPNVRLII